MLCRYCELYESPTVTVGVFLLKRGCVIPYHDHPGMSVATVVMKGALSYHSVRLLPGSPKQPSTWAAGEESHLVMRAGDSLPHIPFNVHRVEALEDSAFLDVITPPYSDERACTYFRKWRHGNGDDDRDGIIRKGDKVETCEEDFVCDQIESKATLTGTL